MQPPWGSESWGTSTKEASLAHLMDPRLATLELTSSIEVKPAANIITTSFSTNALSKKNLRKASSLRPTWKSKKTSSLMRERMHSMVPESCQNFRLSLPADWSVFPHCKFDQVNAHAVHQVLIAVSNMMLVHDDANECQKKRLGLHHDVERLNIRRTSENTGNHLGIIADPKKHLQHQDSHTWYHGAWAHTCSTLQLQSKYYIYWLEAPFTSPRWS